MEQEDSKNGAANPPGESSNPQLSDKNGSNKVTNPPEGSSKPQVSGNKTSKSLKAKPKIVKKSKAGKLKARNEGSQQIGGKTIKKNKKAVGNSDEPTKEKSEKAEKNEEKQIQNGSTGVKSPKEKSTDSKKNKEKEIENGSTSGKSPKEKSEKAEKNKEKEIQNGSTSGKSPIGKRRRPRPRRNKMAKLDKNEQKPKNEEKQRESDKGAGSRINKTNHRGTEKPESSEKNREKVAGFIFMCNSKTKPDCFNYRVMGVSMGKKEAVLGIKPGAKLFLYDFDLKLLYGIYKASSSGGMKLEPRAFGGNFPAQVRFSIASDCFPLPESVFKKAIKENYDERNKFKTELTVRQVRKLTELFKPVDIRSAMHPVRSPAKPIIRDREAHDGVRGSRSRLHREIPNVLSHERDLRIERREEVPRDLSRLHREIPNVLSHEGDIRIERREEVPRDLSRLHREIPNVLSRERDLRIERREEAPRDLFLTEKSYRAYGLQGASQVNPIPHPYERDYEREHHPHLDPNYRRNDALARGAEPLHFSENDNRTYYQGATSDHADDHYHTYRYGASPRERDPYLPPLSREEIPSRSYLVGGRTLVGAENLQRREAVADRLYSTYSAADALSEYNRRQHYHEENLEASAVPVSSRYSFGGPSYSLR